MTPASPVYMGHELCPIASLALEDLCAPFLGRIFPQIEREIRCHSVSLIMWTGVCEAALENSSGYATPTLR